MTRDHEIRHECLLQLYGSKEIAISAAHIRKVAHRQGFDYTEQEIRDAMKILARDSKTLAEPSGAVATAGFLSRRQKLPLSKRTVIVISGGNIEPQMLAEIQA